MSHKGSRSRITDHQAAREAWERVFGKKEKPLPDQKKPEKKKP
jgi:hypothetical protein